MKRITCEVCGSNDLIKQDNVFICQDCRCKYSLEEAKKLIGIVEVVGIDNADTFYNRALDWEKLNDKQKAIKVLEEMVEKYPGDVRGWSKLARLEIHVKMKEYSEWKDSPHSIDFVFWEAQRAIDNATRLGDEEILELKNDIISKDLLKRQTFAKATCDKIRNGIFDKDILKLYDGGKIDSRYDFPMVREFLLEAIENAKNFNDLFKALSPHKLDIPVPLTNSRGYEDYERKFNYFNQAFVAVFGLGNEGLEDYGGSSDTSYSKGFFNYHAYGIYSSVALIFGKTLIAYNVIAEAKMNLTNTTIQQSFSEVERILKKQLCVKCRKKEILPRRQMSLGSSEPEAFLCKRCEKVNSK